jgi:S-(hydroxymethyl)glutathione dehydrogenase/alcohol dehydrogenase
MPKAVVCRELNKPVSVEEVQIDKPGRGEAMVRLVASGVCHSDLSMTNGTLPASLPIVLGHEGAGIVEAVGEGVTRVKKGDAVILSWIPSCGNCRFCLVGSPQLCTNAAYATGGKLKDGTTRMRDLSGADLAMMTATATMSELTVVAEESLVPIDPEVPLNRACLIGCGVMTGVGAVFNTAKLEAGSSAIVFGAGGVGLNVIQGCALSGAAQIIAVDVIEQKLEFSKTFGATHTVNASQQDPVAAAKELTAGLGPDYGFAVIGSPATIEQTHRAVRRGGTAVVVGMGRLTESAQVNALMLAFDEKILTGSYYGGARPLLDFPKLCSLYQQGKLKIDELVTQTYKIDQINEAFQDMETGKNARGIIQF